MRLSYHRFAVLVASSLGLAPLAFAPSAVAAPPHAVSWANASFHGYAAGTEIHASALPVSGTATASVDQAVSGASTNTGGLSSAIHSELGTTVQPAQSASVRAYGTGTGIDVGLAGNHIQQAGLAQQVAPPDNPPVTDSISGSGLPPTVATASLLTGQGAAYWDPIACPIGQDISYGLGNAAAVGLLNPGTGPTLSTAGTGTAVAQTTSATYLSPNGDGTWGISTSAADIIAPITVNIGGQLQLQVAVKSAGGVNDPVTLTAKTTGESTGASLKVSTDDILTVNLIAAGQQPTNVVRVPLSSIGPNGLHIPLSTSNLGGTLTTLTGATAGVVSNVPSVGPIVSGVLTNPAASSLITTVGSSVSQVLNQVATVNLGYIDVNVAPHAIGSTAAPSIHGGTDASGALDLLHMHLGVSATAGGSPLPVPSQLANIADLNVGHLEALAHLAAPITCTLPVIKSVNPQTVAAGGTFTYTIDVPDPAYLGLIDCDLSNMTVTDRISDYQGSPTFTVTGATGGDGSQAKIDQISADQATVTWTGEDYKIESPPSPPLQFTINLSVPSGSPAGDHRRLPGPVGSQRPSAHRLVQSSGTSGDYFGCGQQAPLHGRDGRSVAALGRSRAPWRRRRVSGVGAKSPSTPPELSASPYRYAPTFR
jgi:hypothetical protein